MNTERSLYRVVLILNSIGMLAYVGWLVFGRQRIFYTQDGVLFFLPCIPFFFVYFMLLKSRASRKDE